MDIFIRDTCGCMGNRINPHGKPPENVLYYPHKKQYFEPVIYCDRHTLIRLRSNQKLNKMYLFECECSMVFDSSNGEMEVLSNNPCKKHSNGASDSPFDQ